MNAGRILIIDHDKTIPIFPLRITQTSATPERPGQRPHFSRHLNLWLAFAWIAL